jgi:Zn-dependent M28 family amino/carboxypeptidase
MLNFDVIGAPNYVNFVYDGAPAARPFSATIEKLFLDYYASQHIPNLPTAFNGRSDYGPFIAAGIPAGGLFTGAEGIKTPEQASIWAAPRVSSTTGATTSAATTSSTTPTGRSTRTPTPPPTS